WRCTLGSAAAICKRCDVRENTALVTSQFSHEMRWDIVLLSCYMAALLLVDAKADAVGAEGKR
ncbi:MAG: hypothetical protein KDE50_28425, partial [Caldilineaceae bacterium]|nr:hypothetical protein [Caldilineaceae bacterium]